MTAYKLQTLTVLLAGLVTTVLLVYLAIYVIEGVAR